MAAQIITKEDLDEFREKLLNDLKGLLSKSPNEPAKWLKSYQVKNLLKISPGTLQNLRINGTLRFTKIGGILYYKYEDIIKVLEGNEAGGNDKLKKRQRRLDSENVLDGQVYPERAHLKTGVALMGHLDQKRRFSLIEISPVKVRQKSKSQTGLDFNHQCILAHCPA